MRRTPARRAQLGPVSGPHVRARRGKDGMMSITELTKDSFEASISSGDTLIVDFWAPWCGPCRGFAPVFEQAATEHPDVTFGKVNTDIEQELAGALGIRSIPTLMVFREQVLLFSQPGALSAGQLNELLAKVKEVDMAQVHKDIAAARESAANGTAGDTSQA